MRLPKTKAMDWSSSTKSIDLLLDINNAGESVEVINKIDGMVIKV